ncbi:MAG: YitT family protein [Ruminococcus sp.]
MKTETVKRYLVFAAGLVLTALGIAFTTQSGLGTSPISAIPYTLSLIVPKMTVGNWTIIFSMLLILIQLIIEKREAKKVELLLQIIVTFPFGYIIDFWIFCLEPFAPAVYPMRLLFMIIGCFVLAMGVYFQVTGNVVMLPGDAFVRSVSRAAGKEFGRTRMVSDIVMTAVAFIACLAALHTIQGVREGTVIAALLVGNIVRLYKAKFCGLTDRINSWYSGCAM